MTKHLKETNVEDAANSNIEDKSKQVTIRVGSSDFAMQNVIMQIGIPLISLDGIAINRIKRFKLKCVGCHTMNSKIDIEFCQKCGGHTLQKVSVFVNSNG